MGDASTCMTLWTLNGLPLDKGVTHTVYAEQQGEQVFIKHIENNMMYVNNK